MATSAPNSVKVNAPRPVSESANTSQNPSTNVDRDLPWKTFLGLGLIFIELVLNTGIIWGVFMLLWAVMGISSGQTYILEILERRAHPILFWVTIHLWLYIAAFFFMSNPHIYAFCQMLIVNTGALFS
ncbi:hypothetical protein [Neptuniibacter sp.]|uniref:hypothetical protein n=1 Tax=Neptuniibacter sp. TaxID=1962643 RepID=UPI00261A9468|nr:hypothetical protein [Neptuniibacter sp.]MCP4596280.1 hypothetical protein [Neptuniibacter sp.]